jgi:hypothetical protein
METVSIATSSHRVVRPPPLLGSHSACLPRAIPAAGRRRSGRLAFPGCLPAAKEQAIRKATGEFDFYASPSPLLSTSSISKCV